MGEKYPPKPPQGAESASPPLIPAEEWQQHEHVTPPLQEQAKKLVDATGSPERAKYVVDSLTKKQPATPATKDEFALCCGFTSYLDLFESSTKAGSTDDKNWFITALAGGGWIVWNDVDLDPGAVQPTLEEARRLLPRFT